MNNRGFSFESIVVHTIDIAARLVCVGIFVASAFVWLAILATM